MIKRLREEFIPVTGNTQDLQYHRSPAQEFFLGVVERARRGVPGAETLSRQFEYSHDVQGMYVLGADGTAYGFQSDNDLPFVNRFLDRALKAFRARPPGACAVEDAAVAAPWCTRPPAGAVVVKVFSRIDPLPEVTWPLNRSVGRDYLWIYREEAEELAREVKGGAGATPALPATLARRIVQCHLVDGVRGTPDLWRASEVRQNEVRVCVISRGPRVTRLAFTIDFAMQGRRRSSSNDTPGEVVTQRHAGTLAGEMDVDTVDARVTRFRAYSEGSASGEGTYTPYAPPGEFRLLIAMREAAEGDPIAAVVPPEAVAIHADDALYREGKW